MILVLRELRKTPHSYPDPGQDSSGLALPLPACSLISPNLISIEGRWSTGSSGFDTEQVLVLRGVCLQLVGTAVVELELGADEYLSCLLGSQLQL